MAEPGGEKPSPHSKLPISRRSFITGVLGTGAAALGLGALEQAFRARGFKMAGEDLPYSYSKKEVANWKNTSEDITPEGKLRHTVSLMQGSENPNFVYVGFGLAEVMDNNKNLVIKIAPHGEMQTGMGVAAGLIDIPGPNNIPGRYPMLILDKDFFNESSYEAIAFGAVEAAYLANHTDTTDIARGKITDDPNILAQARAAAVNALRIHEKLTGEFPVVNDLMRDSAFKFNAYDFQPNNPGWIEWVQAHP